MASRSVLILLLLPFLLGCHSSLKMSSYSKYYEFVYKSEQPNFYYSNDKLGISGNWWWNGGARVIPTPRYLPKSIKAVLKNYTSEHGPLLFTTFDPNAKRFKRGQLRTVSKADVRTTHRYSPPIFESVLIANGAFEDTQGNYWLNNSNRYFSIYVRKQINKTNDFRTLELIASEPSRHYTYVCIMDKSFIKNQADSTYQVEQFIDDVHDRFIRKLEPNE